MVRIQTTASDEIKGAVQPLPRVKRINEVGGIKRAFRAFARAAALPYWAAAAAAEGEKKS
jgi:hypothetical protein